LVYNFTNPYPAIDS